MKTQALMKRIAFGFLVGGAILAISSPAISEPDLQSTSQTVEGGKGLLFMPSARTYGKCALVIGAKVLYERREYPVFLTNSKSTDNTTIVGIPITFGLTNYLDITGSIFAFNNVRPYAANLQYGKAESGIGSTYLGAKLRYPFEMDNPIQLALKVGGIFDTSKLQGDGLNYRWAKKGTDYDGSLLQTFDIGEKVSLHFQEGVTFSGSSIYDNQWVGAAGIEYRATDRLRFGLEADNRTFGWEYGTSPQSVFQAGLNPLKYVGGAANAGNPKYVIDGKEDFMKDYFIIAPSLSYQLTNRWALDLGAAINIADQKDPKETVQVVFGLSYGMVTSWCTPRKVAAVPPPPPVIEKPRPAPAPAPKPAVPEPPRRVVEEQPPSDLGLVTVYFDYDKSDIRADQTANLNRDADTLLKWKNVSVRLEGNCDERGTVEYNLALGQRRADAVKNYLVNYGVQESRITTISYGKERPVDSGHNEAAWAKNRRVDFVRQ